MNPDCKGYLTLVLHCHLPYIRHSEHEDTLEERWFYEAMLETYLPLLTLLDRLDHDGVPVRLTISLTPVLLAMMEDPLMQRRFVRYLDRLIELSAKEMKRLAKAPEFRALAGMYGRRFSEFKQFYLACERDVIAQFRRHQEEGRLEILTSAATHAFLPLIKTEEAIRAQIRTAIADYERHFGRKPSGIWLPECAFTPGVDRILNECGIRFFIADTHAVQHATPHPNRGLFAPLATPYGVHAFPRDPASSEQVWSSVSGYPGDVHYREFYRDIGWDLGWNDPEEWEYIRPYVLPTGDRIHTGIKYYRITGSGLEKEPYDPRMAAERAAEHADHFLRQRLEQFREPAERLDRPPLVVSPYDAELFGHWWYEGPHFLEMLFRKLAADYPEIKAVTPSDYLAMYPESDTGKLPACSWGRNHSAEVWLQPENAWIYRHLHEAEERMICLATRARDTRGTDAGRALQHAARQLMLAQSSDWPFIIDAGTVVDYARRRVEGHLNTFRELCDQLEQGAVQSELLAELDERYPCFPKLNASDYAEVEPSSPVSVLSRLVWTQLTERTRWRRNIFMLAWEYPPKNVGGLSKSVCELSETLAELGEIVHVVTPAHYGSPYFELRNGVYIHRVPVLTSGPTDYLHWILEMNLAMTDHLSQWKEAGGRIDILHAHDWMVYDTAHELKQSFGIPFVATIHATEWGRNQGRLHTALQQRIHHLEWQLTYEAEEVFVCSSHMRDEVIRLFGLQEEKVHTVCNGILLGRTGTDQAPERDRNHPIVFFIGRLVYEKGIHTLLQAAPRILEAVPAAQFVIAGEGPLRNELQEIAVKMGLADRVTFTGFLDDAGKTYWYNRASVVVAPSLYEPFGIVALEAMRHRCPVVVSDTGGLAEIVEHGVNGFKALPNHAESLAWQVTQVLREPEQAAKMAEHAYHKLLSEYDWRVLADRVRCVYDRYTAVGAGERTGAAAAARRAANPAVYPAASADRADGGRAVVRAAMSGSKPPAASVGAAVGMNGEEIAGQAQEELVSSLVDFPGEMGVSALNDQGGAEVSDAGESMQAHEPQELSPGAFNLAWRTAWTLK
jgi:1,4-alpha-glucan branching enzyme